MNSCAVSPAPTGPTYVNRYSAYVPLDGLKVRNAIQTVATFPDSKCKTHRRRLNARRSYVDVRGCLQFSPRWFCGSFLLIGVDFAKHYCARCQCLSNFTGSSEKSYRTLPP